MAQTALTSLDNLYRQQFAQIPIRVEAGALTAPSGKPWGWAGSTVKNVWIDEPRFQPLKPVNQLSKRTKRTGLSYRQRQARGRAARVR